LADSNNSDASQFTAYQIPSQNQQPQLSQNQSINENQEEDHFFNAFFTISEFGSPFGFQPIVSRQIRIIHFVDPMEIFNPLMGENGLLNLLSSLRGQGNLVPTTQ